MAWCSTGWSFASSEGLDFSAGEGLVITGSIGAFYIRHVSGHEKTLVFAAGQAGVGAGPLPVSWDISHEDLPASGTEILGWNRNSLTSRELEGLFLLWPNVQGGAGIGGNAMRVEFGYNLHERQGTAYGRIMSVSIGAQCGVSLSAGYGTVTMVIDGRRH
jgi:hypothetical protein